VLIAAAIRWAGWVADQRHEVGPWLLRLGYLAVSNVVAVPRLLPTGALARGAVSGRILLKFDSFCRKLPPADGGNLIIAYGWHVALLQRRGNRTAS
jgi:hypothetical protein